MIKKFWRWLLGLFGIKPARIPDEIYDETTAYVDPEDFNPPWNNADEQFEEDDFIITDEEVADILDEIEEDVEIREPSKFAVIIGINLYDAELNADLNGCVNDAEGMYDILTNTYNFPKDNVRVLTDFRATGEAIFERIEWLVSHNVPGDELVLHYSGHGSQVRDRDGDELNDYLDEILCPTDLDWDNPFTDDEIKWCFDKKADGVFLTFICDSCHSGSITKSIDFTTPETPPKVRYINPPMDIKARDNRDDFIVNKIGTINSNKIAPRGGQSHVLLSGCRDDQTSADAYIDGKYQGALTSALIKTIKANPSKDWTTIHAEVIAFLNARGYSQRPQLSGDNSLIKGRTIFGG